MEALRTTKAVVHAWILGVVLLGLPASGIAQDQDPHEAAPTDALYRADELYFSRRPEEALDALQGVLRHRPRSFGALWRASRAAVSLGLLAEGTAAQNQWYARGADFGRRAANERPERVEGHYWLAANAGLHAVQAGQPGRIVELGEQVHRAVTTVLELNPRHAGAHNVLGRLHFEIMKLSFFERLLGRVVMGSGAIGGASWEGAERHLARAVELDRDFILYRLDLGRLYLRRERPDRAAEELRAALRLEPVHPPDREFQERARRLLRRARSDAGGPEAGGRARP